MSKLQAKILITGKIKTETGLHIGGSKSSLDIGGIDLNVIKTAHGVPFIPGSSLKGKLRSLLAREEDSLDVQEDSPQIRRIFGGQDKNAGKESFAGRIIVRDSMLDEQTFNADQKAGKFSTIETGYTGSKWENTIDRKTGTAINPRQLERVPEGVYFDFEIIYNKMNDGTETEDLDLLKKALRLLRDDYLGGQGSRGYGKISIANIEAHERTIDEYGKEKPSGKKLDNFIL